MKIAIVGGGVAGLACALALRERGHEPIVLEREARAGGKVGTDAMGGWLVERGPAGVLDNAPATQALYTELGLQPVVSDDAARRRYIARKGRLRELPESPPKILLSRTLTLGEKWRIFREPKAPPAPKDVDETLEAFARRRLGPSLAASFVEPIASGVFAGDYARLSVASAFPKVVELERAHGSLIRAMIAIERARRAEGRPRAPARLTTLPGGMGALPAALARALAGALHTGVEVNALERSGEGWRVQTASGPFEVDRVVLALPADEAARLCRPIDAAIADAFAAIPLAGIAAVSLGWARADVAHPLAGFGFLVPRKEQVRLLGAIWMSSTFPAAHQVPEGHVLLRCLIGGATDPAALALSDEELIAIAREGLRGLVGIEAPPRFRHVVRWPRGIAQYEVGHAGRVALIETRAQPLGLYATGASLRGVGVNDVIREARALARRLA
jgi:oxygen-dependent protoporphyrinogen oxidase